MAGRDDITGRDDTNGAVRSSTPARGPTAAGRSATTRRTTAGRATAKATGGRYAGTVRKVSVSLPDDLTEAVRDRVGTGGFSAYVAAALSRQLELDRLSELVSEMQTAAGPAPADLIAEAEAAWPDAK
jgi:Arc/MetJ-type ribon-helix-helix transcriptional regulator